MEKLVLTIPALYADHHTTAVRKILEHIEGVSDVNVSSAFHQVALRFDPMQVQRQAVEKALADQGYETGGVEPVFAVTLADRSTRHSAAYAGTGGSLAFSERTMVREGRPIWPCPGFDVSTPRGPARIKG